MTAEAAMVLVLAMGVAVVVMGMVEVIRWWKGCGGGVSRGGAARPRHTQSRTVDSDLTLIMRIQSPVCSGS